MLKTLKHTILKDRLAAKGTHPGVVVVWRKSKDGNEEKQEQLQRCGDAVVEEIGNAAENAPRDHYCVHDGAQPGLC